jgi:hypothetical protein
MRPREIAVSNEDPAQSEEQQREQQLRGRASNEKCSGGIFCFSVDLCSEKVLPRVPSLLFFLVATSSSPSLPLSIPRGKKIPHLLLLLQKAIHVVIVTSLAFRKKVSE